MELEQLRTSIDEIDDALLRLFLARMSVCEQISSCKQKEGLPIRDLERERMVHEGIQKKAGDMGAYAYPLFSTLMDLSRTYQSLQRGTSSVAETIKAGRAQTEPISGSRVAFYGKTGAAAAAVCARLVPNGEVLRADSVQAVFGMLDSGLCRYGILPMDGKEADTPFVFSRLQKGDWFCVGRTDTPERYLCVEVRPAIHCGADRIGLAVSCQNGADALCAVLSAVHAHRIPVSRVELWNSSFSDVDGTFFVELKASAHEENLLVLLTELEQTCEGFSYLGNYAVV